MKNVRKITLEKEKNDIFMEFSSIFVNFDKSREILT